MLMIIDNVDVNDNNEFYIFDILDPRNQEAFDSNMINILALKCDKRDLSIVKSPKDKYLKRFSETYYFITLPNREYMIRFDLCILKKIKYFVFFVKYFDKDVQRVN